MRKQNTGISIKVEELRSRVQLVLADFKGVLFALFSEYCKARLLVEEWGLLPAARVELLSR